MRRAADLEATRRAWPFWLGTAMLNHGATTNTRHLASSHCYVSAPITPEQPSARATVDADVEAPGEQAGT
jgi:hypothetical protein